MYNRERALKIEEENYNRIGATLAVITEGKLKDFSADNCETWHIVMPTFEIPCTCGLCGLARRSTFAQAVHVYEQVMPVDDGPMAFEITNLKTRVHPLVTLEMDTVYCGTCAAKNKPVLVGVRKLVGTH